MFTTIDVPQAVIHEIEQGSHDDVLKQQLHLLSWIRIIKIEPPLSPLASWHLGRGESEVIEWARLNESPLALLDDRMARKAAEALDISVCGTLGLLAKSYKKKIIPSLSRAIENVKNAGLYVDDKLIEKIIDTLI